MRFFARLFCLSLIIGTIVTSCQKDENVKKEETKLADSTKNLNIVSMPGNYLADKGLLTIKLQDSTYTFDAQQDSIAFVNVTIDGSQYYGVTAINKAHTISFGISSSGVPIDELSSYVSGAQFLIHGPAKTNLEYTLVQNSRQQNPGTISIEKYNRDTTLAKGTFHTYLAKDTKANSPSCTVDGSFELKLK